MDVSQALLSKKCLLGRQVLVHCGFRVSVLMLPGVQFVPAATKICWRRGNILLSGRSKSQSVLQGTRLLRMPSSVWCKLWGDLLRQKVLYNPPIYIRYLQTVMKEVFQSCILGHSSSINPSINSTLDKPICAIIFSIWPTRWLLHSLLTWWSLPPRFPCFFHWGKAYCPGLICL